MLTISHSCMKLTSRSNHRDSTTLVSISINRKIAIWMNFLAVQDSKDVPKLYLIIDTVNVTCGHERRKKCDNS